MMRSRNLRSIGYIVIGTIVWLNSSDVFARPHQCCGDNSMKYPSGGSNRVAFISAKPTKPLQQKQLQYGESKASPCAEDTNHGQNNDWRKSQLFGSNVIEEPSLSPGQVLLPSLEGDEIQFDTACVANPVVSSCLCELYSLIDCYSYILVLLMVSCV
jgi:hypothetical protein